ncbi:hypothetical protein B0H14DRAFT_2620848 [Mycena olivaceomarginata]|nr:hypothetical protein B0H14DRAFT_2620848 [Mycena olivaceomarginata]
MERRIGGTSAVGANERGGLPDCGALGHTGAQSSTPGRRRAATGWGREKKDQPTSINHAIYGTSVIDRMESSWSVGETDALSVPASKNLSDTEVADSEPVRHARKRAADVHGSRHILSVLQAVKILMPVVTRRKELHPGNLKIYFKVVNVVTMAKTEEE